MGVRGMQRFLTWIVVLAVLGAALSFVSAPYVGFFALRSAAQSEDVQGLSQLVDFDAVRASLRPQLVSATPVQAPPPSVWQDPLGALKHAIEPLQQPAPDVDAYLSPRALAALTRGAGRDAAKAGPTPPGTKTLSAPWPKVRYWGVNRSRLVIPGSGGDTVFTFERKGIFVWKLVHLGLPAKAPAAARG
jgi:hypothetical protein